MILLYLNRIDFQSINRDNARLNPLFIAEGILGMKDVACHGTFSLTFNSLLNPNIANCFSKCVFISRVHLI